MFWIIAVVLIIVYGGGLILHIGGLFIHILLVLAVISIIMNFVRGRGL